MYGNMETALDTAWAAGEGSPHPPPDEDPYEPLDPSPTPGPPKGRPSPTPGASVTLGTPRVTPRGALVALVALVALAVTLLLLLGTLGARRISDLEAALEAEKAKEPPPTAASPWFLLYNQHHSGCVVPSGQWLSLSRCDPSSASQRFQWLPGGLLRHAGTGLCVGATRDAPAALVGLRPCQAGSRLQRWGCARGALLGLAGTALNFNFGHERQRRVLLYGGTGNWSRWLAHGSERDVCSKACNWSRWLAHGSERDVCSQAYFLPCSQGWVFFRHSCYFFSSFAASWDNSRTFCWALGARLLEVDDSEEKALVQAQLRGPSWLGIRDSDREGTWSRGDGTALSPELSFWHPGEPNGGTRENCAAVGPDGLWADYPCETPLGWVCEGAP